MHILVTATNRGIFANYDKQMAEFFNKTIYSINIASAIKRLLFIHIDI